MPNKLGRVTHRTLAGVSRWQASIDCIANGLREEDGGMVAGTAAILGEDMKNQLHLGILQHNPKECSTCRWWITHSLFGGGLIGECRRNAPVVMPNSYTVEERCAYVEKVTPVTRWPETKSTDSCGQWETKN
jgi:hypothetical protein